MSRMSKEEKDILASFERREWKPVHDLKKKMNRYQKIARLTLRKDKRINIRISTRDLEEIQKKALEEGIPYQTLISSVLHKYVSRGLDKTTA